MKFLLHAIVVFLIVAAAIYFSATANAEERNVDLGSSTKDNPNNSKQMSQRNKVIQAASMALGSLDSTQQSSLNNIIDSFTQYGDKDSSKLFYIIATAWHECRLKPIKEFRANVGTSLRTRQDKYWSGGYYGRGLVQLTWKNNYLKMGEFLNIDLVNNPDLALNPIYAAKIIVYGMINGSFTGRKLSKHINSFGVDYVNARRTVNGTDKATLIANYAFDIQHHFENLQNEYV